MRSSRSGICARWGSTPAMSSPPATSATSPRASKTWRTPASATPSPRACAPAPRRCPATARRAAWSTAAFTPSDGSKFPDLRDALDKLKLNDASLSYEPETSIALGYGFRCGFLGMLHMEVIQERLEREFNLDLVTTLPSVIYEVKKTDGTTVFVDNPHNYPDPASIAEALEPFVKVTIITPNEFVGNIMPLCQERRGVYKNMQYLDQRLVEMHYEMPLNEIIYDFFDTLKAKTKGYASLDYELVGVRPVRSREGRYAPERRSGGRAELHRPPRKGLRPRA